MNIFQFSSWLAAVAGITPALEACSILYYFDESTATAYVANNEDYWYDQSVVLKKPRTRKGEYARLWYGWDDFAQGGVNEQGLFLDGAVIPERRIPDGLKPPQGNLGDRLLANCQTVKEALQLLETEAVGLTNAHLMIGDASGSAVVIEWDENGRHLQWVEDGHLVITNFSLSPQPNEVAMCPRYQSIKERISAFRERAVPPTLLIVGNFLGAAAQPPRTDENGRMAGTLYSTFIDLKQLQLVFVPKLDSSKAEKLDLGALFSERKEKTLRFK